MEDSAPPHRLLLGGGGSPRHVGGPRRELSRAGASSNLGPSSCPYSPNDVEYEFSEVRLLGFLRSSSLRKKFRKVSPVTLFVTFRRRSHARVGPLIGSVAGEVSPRPRGRERARP